MDPIRKPVMGHDAQLTGVAAKFVLRNQVARSSGIIGCTITLARRPARRPVWNGRQDTPITNPTEVVDGPIVRSMKL